jgi:hypothetical protein
MVVRDKRSCLLRKSVNYGRKKFYNIGRRSATTTTTTAIFDLKPVTPWQGVEPSPLSFKRRTGNHRVNVKMRRIFLVTTSYNSFVGDRQNKLERFFVESNFGRVKIIAGRPQ